ncbi:MAG: VanZ family protein [Planctomycetota bacterium]
MNRLVVVIMRWLVVVCYAMLLVTVSPGRLLPPQAAQIVGVDKLLHLVGYGFLCLLVCRALVATHGRKLGPPMLFLAFMLTALYGAFDEVRQACEPNRTASVFDLFADGIGALIVVWMWPKITARWRFLMQ